jgi:chromosome partitioning protein
MKVISTAIIKGGTGKTTTVCALAQAAALDGRRVLVIDLDPQGNATSILGADGASGSGSYDILTGTADASSAIVVGSQNIPVIGGSPELATIKSSNGGALTLRKALETVKDDFDIVFVDTPPHIGELVLNALVAADVILVPLETDKWSINGLQHIGGLIRNVRKVNDRLSLIGVLLTRFDGRSKLNQAFRTTIEKRAPGIDAKFLGCVRNGVAVKEAQTLGKSLYEYARNSNPAKDYRAILAAILND